MEAIKYQYNSNQDLVDVNGDAKPRIYGAGLN